MSVCVCAGVFELHWQKIHICYVHTAQNVNRLVKHFPSQSDDRFIDEDIDQL